MSDHLAASGHAAAHAAAAFLPKSVHRRAMLTQDDDLAVDSRPILASGSGTGSGSGSGSGHMAHPMMALRHSLENLSLRNCSLQVT